tara:strand:- start:56808 stop:57521 length:714 start_codon:yes stop_codon:yes gene_type:complete
MNKHTPTPELLSNFRTPAFPGSYFLSFEGIEGAGKSTQIQSVIEHLEKRGMRVLVVREPGGTPFGERLRQAVLGANHDLHPLAEAHLFASSRAQLLHEVVMKELAVAGTVIICDRYIDSTLAYQGLARDLGAATVLELHRAFPLCLVPHLTFYLRIGVATSHARQKIRNAPKDYFERQGDNFYAKLVEGYDMAAQLFPNRISVIDGERGFEAVNVDIIARLEQLLTARKDHHPHHDD